SDATAFPNVMVFFKKLVEPFVFSALCYSDYNVFAAEGSLVALFFFFVLSIHQRYQSKNRRTCLAKMTLFNKYRR
ncbi:MAG: hypothetical protein PF904_12300, partial [Kiritimatiellae bacterium]|nr:hypothetical protein [Kiritimatiellia bacterium]